MGVSRTTLYNMVSSNGNPTRIITVDKNSYIVSNSTNEAFAELSGKFMFNAGSSLDYPTVGDWVSVEFFNDGTFAVINEVLPRKTLLSRKTAGKKIEYQLINVCFRYNTIT